MRLQGRVLLPLIQTFLVAYAVFTATFEFTYGTGNIYRAVEGILIAVIGVGCAYFQLTYLYQDHNTSLQLEDEIKKRYK